MFIGSVVCEADVAQVLYMVGKRTPTGACVVLVIGIVHPLCTNLEAVSNDKVECGTQAENWRTAVLRL